MMYRHARCRRPIGPDPRPTPPPHPLGSLEPPPIDALLAAFREARYHNGLQCPRCHARHPIQRWGSFSGRQRFRCMRCRRTFSDLTATPAAYSKKLPLWVAYARWLQYSLSVRQAAKRTGIHPCTAFRWRHRFLDHLRTHDHQTLGPGWIEVTALFFAYSEKGRRNLDRAPRPHGTPFLRFSRHVPRVHVLAACNRLGDVVTARMPPPYGRYIEREDFETLLGPRLRGSPHIFCARHSPDSPVGLFAQQRGCAFHDVRRERLFNSAEYPVLPHVRTIRDYTDRFIVWMERFYGVATRYLPNYLIWHAVLDRAVRHSCAALVLRWTLEEPAD